MENRPGKDYFKQFIPKKGLPEEIYRFYKIDEHLKDALRKGYLWFSKPSDFNDPFDCYLDLVSFTGPADHIGKLVKERGPGNRQERRAKSRELMKKPKLVSSTYRAIVEGSRETMGVCCFSLNHNHTLMWSHYASNHKGLCLVFNPWLDTFFQVAEVAYTNAFTQYNYFDHTESALFRMAVAKSKDWEYEEEVRIILTDRNGKQHFKKQALTGIIFGCKTSLADKAAIMQLIQESGYADIHYRQAYTESNSFQLSFRDLDI